MFNLLNAICHNLYGLGLNVTWISAETFHCLFDYVCHANSLDQDVRCLSLGVILGTHNCIE